MDNALQEVPKQFRKNIPYYKPCQAGEWVNHSTDQIVQVIEPSRVIYSDDHITLHTVTVDTRTRRAGETLDLAQYREWQWKFLTWLYIPL